MNTDCLELSQARYSKLPDIKRKLPASTYLAIAQAIIRKTGVYKGNCLEINDGNCFIGIALAQLTKMQIYLMENSESVIEHVAFHLNQNDFTGRIQLIKGHLRQIPIADQQMNLVVYRKSIFSWRSQLKVFQEIYRVLAPGGVAYIRDDSWDGQKWISIENKLKEYGQILSEQLNGLWLHRMENVKTKITQAGITSFEMDCNSEGLRIIIRRPLEQARGKVS